MQVPFELICSLADFSSTSLSAQVEPSILIHQPPDLGLVAEQHSRMDGKALGLHQARVDRRHLPHKGVNVSYPRLHEEARSQKWNNLWEVSHFPPFVTLCLHSTILHFPASSEMFSHK